MDHSQIIHPEFFPTSSENSSSFRPKIIFVPFFKGRIKDIKKHISFVNDLGFDAYAFDFPELSSTMRQGFSKSGSFGIKKILADNIEFLLNVVEGPKIVFAFSNPCSAAIEAVSRRNASDILGMVCEMGPSGEAFKSYLNYFTYAEKIPTLALRWAAASATVIAWGANVVEDLKRDLASLPSGFQILSIRGWKDVLIPPHAIDKVFNEHSHLDWRKLDFVEAAHLKALRDYSDEYKFPVAEFLFEISKQS